MTLNDIEPDGGEPAIRFEGAELLQQRETVVDRPGVRTFDERELGELTELQGDHLQDDRREVRAEDLGVGELGTGVEVVLAVEADADPVRDAATASRPLVGARLRDLLDRQPLHLQPARVPGDARGAGIDDVADPRHGQ
jgi:hypothetical protein